MSGTLTLAKRLKKARRTAGSSSFLRRDHRLQVRPIVGVPVIGCDVCGNLPICTIVDIVIGIAVEHILFAQPATEGIFSVIGQAGVDVEPGAAFVDIETEGNAGELLAEHFDEAGVAVAVVALVQQGVFWPLAPIDMIDLCRQMGVDLMARMRRQIADRRQ